MARDGARGSDFAYFAMSDEEMYRELRRHRCICGHWMREHFASTYFDWKTKQDDAVIECELCGCDDFQPEEYRVQRPEGAIWSQGESGDE